MSWQGQREQSSTSIHNPQPSAADIHEERQRIAENALHARTILGLDVWPLGHPWEGESGKAPARRFARAWSTRPRLDERELVSALTVGPLRNYAIRTGGELAPIDVDLYKDPGLAAWTELHFPELPACTVDSGGGGRHIYARKNPGDRVIAQPLPGVEVLAERHLIVGPGSRHASGRLYQAHGWPWSVADLAERPVLPAGLLRARRGHRYLSAISERAHPAPARDDALARMMAHAAKVPGLEADTGEGRNVRLFGMARLFFGPRYRAGLDDALATLRAWNAKNLPPIPDRALTATVRSAWKWRQAHPLPARGGLVSNREGAACPLLKESLQYASPQGGLAAKDHSPSMAPTPRPGEAPPTAPHLLTTPRSRKGGAPKREGSGPSGTTAPQRMRDLGTEGEQQQQETATAGSPEPGALADLGDPPLLLWPLSCVQELKDWAGSSSGRALEGPARGLQGEEEGLLSRAAELARLEPADDIPGPDGALLGLCRALARLSQDGLFYLGKRDTALLLGIGRTSAGNLLRRAARTGFLAAEPYTGGDQFRRLARAYRLREDWRP